MGADFGKYLLKKFFKSWSCIKRSFFWAQTPVETVIVIRSSFLGEALRDVKEGTAPTSQYISEFMVS